MTREDIEQKVNEVLIDVLYIDHAVIRNDAKLEDDLDTDSLDCVEIIIGLEHKFKISIPDEKAEAVTTIDELYDMVEEILQPHTESATRNGFCRRFPFFLNQKTNNEQ